MAKLFIENLLKGIVYDPTGSNVAAVEGNKFEYSRSGGIDFFRQGFYGHMTTAQIFTNGSFSHANINSHIRATAQDPVQTGAHVYLLNGGLSGTAPRIERIENGVFQTTGSNVISAHGGHNFTTLPTGTGFWGEDVAFYNVSGGSRFFYSWNDNVDGDVGTVIPTSGTPTYDDDFMSTVPTGAAALTLNVPHKMVEGANKKLYITNGRYVSEYDGATNTFTATRYDLGVGWIATDVRNYKGFLVITAINTGTAYRITNFNQSSRVCIWNMVEPGLGQVYDIRDGWISSAFVGDDGRLYCFTQGNNASGKIRRFNGSEFVILKEWQTALYGTIPQPNSIESYFGLIMWLPGDSAGDFVMGYDPKFDALHVPYFVADSTNSSTSHGVLKNIDSKNLYVSALLAGTYKLIYLSGSGAYSTNVSVDLRTVNYRLPFKSVIKRIVVYFSQIASDGQAIISLFKNYATLSIGGVADQMNKTIDFTTYGALTEYEFNKTIPNVSSFYMNFRLSGQVSISRVEVEYESLK